MNGVLSMSAKTLAVVVRHARVFGSAAMIGFRRASGGPHAKDGGTQDQFEPVLIRPRTGVRGSEVYAGSRRFRCVLALVWALVLPIGPARGDDDAYESRRALQELFHRAADRAAPWVVQIETIGGAQPRDGAAANDELPPDEMPSPDDVPPPDEDDGTPPAEENLFRDTLGSSFVVADGPTTGIVYTSDGWILTSSFNFVREPTHTTVAFSDGRRFVAKLVGRDKVRKLAMLKIDADGLETPEWAATDEIRVGQWALALGRGFGGSQPSVTVGVVSALDRMMGNAIQTDAKLSPADYGGPLVDVQGRVLGICVPMAQRPGELAGVEFYDAGVGFAIPEHRVRELAGELQQGKTFYRGWLGVQTDFRVRGALVISRVADPSPVAGVGIRAGETIVQANGREVRNIDHLRKAVYMLPAGEPVQLVVRRKGLDYGYEVVLAKSDDLGPLAEVVPQVDMNKPFTAPSTRGRAWPSP
ncbi:MAG: PDZ domain-containing protein [Phycisphaerales bacterium]|nr:PDZ domain-containing protein [Phycisphaerales bacterium]